VVPSACSPELEFHMFSSSNSTTYSSTFITTARPVVILERSREVRLPDWKSNTQAPISRAPNINEEFVEVFYWTQSRYNYPGQLERYKKNLCYCCADCPACRQESDRIAAMDRHRPLTQSGGASTLRRDNHRASDQSIFYHGCIQAYLRDISVGSTTNLANLKPSKRRLDLLTSTGSVIRPISQVDSADLPPLFSTMLETRGFSLLLPLPITLTLWMINLSRARPWVFAHLTQIFRSTGASLLRDSLREHEASHVHHSDQRASSQFSRATATQGYQ
ncbi:unnamed protein product, partial [Nesidiocoris tenuis]